MSKLVIEELNDHQNIIQKVIATLSGDIESACEMITTTLKNGNKVLVAGNGGSAAETAAIRSQSNADLRSAVQQLFGTG